MNYLKLSEDLKGNLKLLEILRDLGEAQTRWFALMNQTLQIPIWTKVNNAIVVVCGFQKIVKMDYVWMVYLLHYLNFCFEQFL